MKINIQAPWEVNDHLREVIETKMEKLTDYFDRIIHADIFLKTKANEKPNDKMIEVIIRTAGPDIFAKSQTATFETAMADVAEKLRRQVIKRKEMQQ